MPKFNLNKSEYDESTGEFEKLPEGEYKFQITNWTTERKDGSTLETKVGDPMVQITCEVVDNGKYDGRKVWHNVILYRPNSPSIKGMWSTRVFLKCIGEPHEGDIEVDPDNWIPRQFKATIKHNGDYTNIDQFIYEEESEAKKATGHDDIAWEE